MAEKRSFGDKFFKDDDGQVVLGQKPNPPIILWFVFTVLTHFLHGSAQSICSIIALISLVIWGLLEIFRGATYARRLLGLVVLLVVVISRV